MNETEQQEIFNYFSSAHNILLMADDFYMIKETSKSTVEQLQNFLTIYMCLRKMQTEYFKFKSNAVLKGCKLLEQNLDALAQRLMIDLDMNFSLLPEQPKLF